MTPVRFIGDLVNFCRGVQLREEKGNGDIQAKRFLCTIERIALAVLTYFVLDTLRDRMSLLEFRALFWLAIVVSRESYLGLAAYSLLLGLKQMKAYQGGSLEVSGWMLLYGVGNAALAAQLDGWYRAYLDQVVDGFSPRELPPVLLTKKSHQLHYRVVAWLAAISQRNTN